MGYGTYGLLDWMAKVLSWGWTCFSSLLPVGVFLVG